MAKSKPELLQGLEQHLKSGGESTMKALCARFEVSSKVIAAALSELARKGVVEAVNPNAKRKRYRLVGAQTSPARTRGRPAGTGSERLTLNRLKAIRLALDPKGNDPFWRKLESDLQAYYRIRAALK